MKLKTLAVLIIFLTRFTPLFSSSIEERLKNFSLHEKFCMRKFFDYAFRKDQLGHVLYFNTKPACLTSLILKSKDKTFEDNLCFKGWIAFKRKEYLFPHPNFIINEQVYDNEECKILDIFFINKKSIFKCLNHHLSYFKDILGSNFTPEWFISELMNGIPLTTLIQNDDFLLGLLLGFGEESSRAYQEQQRKKNNDAPPKWTDNYCGVGSDKPKGGKIYSVGFMGYPKSPQVKEIISLYEKEADEILIMYNRINDSLFMALEKLCTE